MDLTQSVSLVPARTRHLAYRLIVPGTVLLPYLALAALWHWGPSSLYFAALRQFAFEPFRFPFLDIDAVLAAAQCNRAGIDVYMWNPCDVLGRPHVYSPLWLKIIPGFLDTGARTAVGLGLGVLFVASIAATCRPKSRAEVLFMALTALSPMTVYALERANNDLVVFMLILAGCAFLRASGPSRFAAYALYLIAGLLKYYPLALLIMLARERQRDAILAATVVTSLLLGLIVGDHAELAKALSNIPSPSYYGGSFAAVNLPFGLATALAVPPPRFFAVALLAVLGGLALARTRRLAQVLHAARPDCNSFEKECLIAGAILLIACFLAARNVDYRGIYFAMVMPGLIQLRRICRQPEVQHFFSRMIAAVLFVGWEEPLRHAVQMAAASIPGEGLRVRIEILFWLSRELVWWWLIAGLAAIVCCYLRSLPVAGAIISALPKYRRAPRLAR
ncbi:MAG: DUF2029 domain-containing protein [Alphaproteobacteria bacterium]|nr:DUF2029 domain-containing protein [Alphaproteobacteria bacterium]